MASDSDRKNATFSVFRYPSEDCIASGVGKQEALGWIESFNSLGAAKGKYALAVEERPTRARKLAELRELEENPHHE